MKQMKTSEARILDACCGSRMFWFDKAEPHTTYMDIRQETFEIHGKKVNVKKAIKNSIEDFRLLFPNEPVTSAHMTDWCGIGRRDRIFRVLREEYTSKGSGNARYYE